MTVGKNGEVKNGWGIEESSVGWDCRDAFVNKWGDEKRRWTLTVVEERIVSGNGWGCYMSKWVVKMRVGLPFFKEFSMRSIKIWDDADWVAWL